MPADTALAVPEPVLGDAGPAATGSLGQSSRRRVLGLVGQYALLVALAAVVLVPVAFALVQALSPPFAYFDAGKPLHPVAVAWKDRTWTSGGWVSVVVRTLLVAVALGWAQLRAAGQRAWAVRSLTARQIAAVVIGTLVAALLVQATWRSLQDRGPATAAWWIAGAAGVAVTAFVGFPAQMPRGRRIATAAALGVGLVSIVVIVFGAAVWSQGWDQGDLGPAMGRSLVVATLITAAQVVTSVLAAYAFAFLRFPLKSVVFALFMSTLLLPLEVTLLANVQTIRQAGWVNSNAGLVLPFAATAFGTFLIRQGFRGLPPEIHDATRIDGYGHLQFLWRFAVPLTRPVIASFVVISALGAWNQYLWPQAVIDDERYQTAQIRLRTITGVEVANANVSIAAALIVAVPVVLLLIAFSRQIIRGLTAGAVKG